MLICNRQTDTERNTTTAYIRMVNGCAVNAVAEAYKASSSAKYLLRGNRQAVSVPGRDVKTVPRRLVAFAGRLHIDTTEDQLKEFLKDAGLVDLKCRRLENSSIAVGRYSSRKPWRLQFHNSELYFRTRPPNLCSHRRCERNFVPIPTHFYHATTLQLRAFARHSAS